MDNDQRAVGVEMNGHHWDGTRWVPIRPPSPRATTQTTAQGAGGFSPPSHLWSQRLQPPGGGFSDPHYGYGLTRQTSDDLQFIARFFKIMIILWIIAVTLSLVVLPLMLGSILAAISSALPHAAR